MTHPAVTTQHKVAYANNLRKTIEASGLSIRAWSKKHDIGVGSVQKILQGKHMPTPATAERLANATGLERFVTDALIKVNCGLCNMEFFCYSRQLTRNKLFCGQGCRQANYRKLKRGYAAKKFIIDNRRLELYREAVALHCNACGGQLCPDAGCELRRISPLPLRRENHANQQHTGPTSLVARRASLRPDAYRGVIFVQRIPNADTGTKPIPAIKPTDT